MIDRMKFNGGGSTMRSRRMVIAVGFALATTLAAGCSGEGAAGTREASASASAMRTEAAPSSQGEAITDGLYLATVTKREALKIDPEAVHESPDLFPHGETTMAFGLRLDAGYWVITVIDGQKQEVGDSGTYEIDGDTIALTSEPGGSVYTFAWTLTDGVLTLHRRSSTGDGPWRGFYGGELIVMEHGWTLQS
jgi:hypothetical protein